MKNIEIERTFLARSLPTVLTSVQPVHLSDTYVPQDSPAPYVRLRQQGDTFVIVKKVPIDGDLSHHTEDDIALSEEEFEALRACSQRRVEKDRYYVTIDGYDAQFDVFTDTFKGLVLIDFEFASLDDRDTFIVPNYCLAEVTEELFIAGGQLAGKAYSDIEADLARFNYQKLVL